MNGLVLSLSAKLAAHPRDVWRSDLQSLDRAEKLSRYVERGGVAKDLRGGGKNLESRKESFHKRIPKGSANP